MIDLHCHSRFSIDSTIEPETLIEAARAKGLHAVAFTDHADFAPGDSIFDPDEYLRILAPWRDLDGPLIVLAGVELGIQADHAKQAAAFLGTRDFDLVIASMHRVRGADLALPGWTEGKTVEQAWEEYFRDALVSVKGTPDFDVFGHIDIPRRYGLLRGTTPSGRAREALDDLLNWLIAEEKTLEINGSGFRYGLESCHPESWILDRYLALGGRLFTTGSDTHTLPDLGQVVGPARLELQRLGIGELQMFRHRRRQAMRLV